MLAIKLLFVFSIGNEVLINPINQACLIVKKYRILKGCFFVFFSFAAELHK